MDSALSICVWERHVRSCTFPYCFCCRAFFLTVAAAEVILTYSIYERFMDEPILYPYAFTNGLVHKNSV